MAKMATISTVATNAASTLYDFFFRIFLHRDFFLLGILFTNFLYVFVVTFRIALKIVREVRKKFICIQQNQRIYFMGKERHYLTIYEHLFCRISFKIWCSHRLCEYIDF